LKRREEKRREEKRREEKRREEKRREEKRREEKRRKWRGKQPETLHFTGFEGSQVLTLVLLVKVCWTEGKALGSGLRNNEA
jgi:hypothetical protein